MVKSWVFNLLPKLRMIEYRRDIDGLRALAVLAVVLYHAGFGFMQAGYLGVDIFFVISGYLITSLIIKDQAAGTFMLRNFWERRVRRIVPALCLVTICSIAVGQFILLAPDNKMLGEQVISQSMFASNILFASQLGYFDPQGLNKPLLHTWSLAVEEQFYLLFPLLMLVAFRYTPRRIPFILMAVLAVSYALCVYGSLYYPFPTFYLLPGRAWELLLGALVCFIPVVKLGRVEREGLSALALGAIFLALLSFESYTTHIWTIMILPCLGTATLLWLGRANATCVTKILSWKALTGIGLISYSLYLWHWPVFVYARYLQVDELSVHVKTGLILLSMMLAALSWKYVETPVRRKAILPTSAQLFKAAAGAMGVLLITGGALYASSGAPGRFEDQINRYAAAVYDINPRQEECHHTSPVDIRQTGLCRLGPRDQIPEFLAFGDSEAEALMPVLDALAEETSTPGLFASYNSCPPLFDTGRPDHQKSFDCRGFNDAIKDAIVKTKVRRVLLIARWSAYADMYLLSDDQHPVPASFDENRQIFETRLGATIHELQKQGIEVWLVMQSPEYKFDVPRRLANEVRQGRDVTGIGQSVEDYAKKREVLANVLGTVTGLHVIELNRLCTGDICMTASQGRSLYKDSHHLSAFGADFVKPDLVPFFDK